MYRNETLKFIKTEKCFPLTKCWEKIVKGLEMADPEQYDVQDFWVQFILEIDDLCYPFCVSIETQGIRLNCDFSFKSISESSWTPVL